MMIVFDKGRGREKMGEFWDVMGAKGNQSSAGGRKIVSLFSCHSSAHTINNDFSCPSVGDFRSLSAVGKINPGRRQTKAKGKKFVVLKIVAFTEPWEEMTKRNWLQGESWLTKMQSWSIAEIDECEMENGKCGCETIVVGTVLMHEKWKRKLFRFVKICIWRADGAWLVESGISHDSCWY